MDERFLFSSHSLEYLADELFCQLSRDRTSIFSRGLIVIPHICLKEWLQMELCKRDKNKAILGLEFVHWEEVLPRLAVPSRGTLLAAIWQKIEKKKLDFAEHLATLFWQYCHFGFPQEIPEEALWQKKLFEDIFREYNWQTLPEALTNKVPQNTDPLYLFGIDYLPAAVYRFFLLHPKLNVFRFSPTSMFWEDVNRSNKVQPLLSNWGALGRKMLADASTINSQEGENYDLEGQDSNLQRLKLDFLLLEKQEFIATCPSIQCLQAGSSKLKEVEILRQTILELVEEKIPLSSIHVYAPDIEPYVPLIEFCFGDALPYRIRGIDFSRQSPFYQAIVRLFSCVEGRWGQEEVLALFEISALYRKMHWQKEEVQRFREWVLRANIRWGLDRGHRKEIAQANATEAGTWKRGFETLLDSWIFLQPTSEEAMSWLEVDLFQSFYEKFDTLRKTLRSWKTEKTFACWAEEIEAFIDSTLFLDESSDTDRAAMRCFSQFLESLRDKARDFPSEYFPFSLIKSYFSTHSSDELSRSSLHAVRFSSLDLGSLISADAVILLGLDEESFPRRSHPSSLRLLTEQPSPSEKDRYLFLQAIFAAKKRLIFSYSHQSKEDGKSVNPSLLIQELFGYIGPHYKTVAVSEPKPKCLSFLKNSTEIPLLSSIPSTLSIQELVRFFKNPFQYYLKTLRISLPEEPDSNWEEFEMSGLERHLALKEALTKETPTPLPLGLFGQAAKVHLDLAISQFKESLEKWAIAPSSIQTLTFKETATPIVVRVQDKSILLTGEVGLSVPTGVLHMGRDEIGSYLRKWPELLCALVATESCRIHALKTGRVREVVDPAAALEKIVELYLRCQNHPFFLHPEWADDVLRKDRAPESSEDPIVQWAFMRSPDYCPALEKELWKPLLDSVFSPLTTLFERGAHAAV